LEQLALTARVACVQDDKDSVWYVARVDGLPLEGEGDSVESAQEDLVQVMRGWIEAQDGTESLETTLAQAGFPGVDEDTELQLEFEPMPAPPSVKNGQTLPSY
jgi:hypothetical protein